MPRYRFLSTLSLRRATTMDDQIVAIPRFLSTLSLRRATGVLGWRIWHRQQFLSTLSLRRATHPFLCTSKNKYISIHALLAESDEAEFFCIGQPVIFLSTLSLRRATASKRAQQTNNQISIHALLAESDHLQRLLCVANSCISIHALLAESDSPSIFFYIILQNFYPRSPCGERPVKGKPAPPVIRISIHALLAESDLPAR